MNQYVIFTSEKGVCAQTPVTGHFTELLLYQIESYRIRGIEYLSNKNESYRIII